MSEQPVANAIAEYISDEELDSTYVDPEEGDEESHNEELLDSLAAQAGLKEENYVDDEGLEDE